MMNAILTGLGAAASSRSDTASTTAQSTMPSLYRLILPDGKDALVPEEEAKALKHLMDIYDLCTEYAYPNLRPPEWSDVVEYGDVVLEWYRKGIPFNADLYEWLVSTGREVVPKNQQDYFALISAKTITLWMAAHEEKEQATTTPEEDIPDDDVPKGNEKSPNWSLIGIIGACLVGIGALVFSGKSKKKRR